MRWQDKDLSALMYESGRESHADCNLAPSLVLLRTSGLGSANLQGARDALKDPSHTIENMLLI